MSNLSVTAKLINKYIQIVFKDRKLLDDGVPVLLTGYEGGVMTHNEFFDDSLDIDLTSDWV